MNLTVKTFLILIFQFKTKMENDKTAGRRRTRGITNALKSTMVDRMDEGKRVLSPFRPAPDVVQQ